MMKPRGSMTVIFSIGIIGALILFLATSNFVNSTTARAGTRAIEVGVRKVAGARRQDLMVQFLGESFLYVALASCLAVCLVQGFLPVFNAILDRSISFWSNGALLAAVGGIAITVAILGGAYPAFVLSAFHPAWVFKAGVVRSSGSLAVRRALVVIQFAILIALLVATGVVRHQISYATGQAQRLNIENVLLINSKCTDIVRNSIRELPGVKGVACSWIAPTNLGKIQGSAVLGNGTKALLFRSSVGVGFFELYGLQPLAGRFFSDQHGSDVLSVDQDRPFSAPVVLNEAAMHALGISSPSAAIGQHVSISDLSATTRPSEIIGVVADFPVGSIREAIDPTAFFVDPTQFRLVSVKLSGIDVPATLQSLNGLSSSLGGPTGFQTRFLSQYVQDLYKDVTRESTILSTMASIAVLLACFGLFGLSVFTVQRRTREIGVRKALGAGTGDIVRLLVWQFTTPILWANLVAWPIAAFVMSRWLESFAFHIHLEILLFMICSAISLCIALLTVGAHCYLAAREKPIYALRYE
jgi:putative ABC transport system permease protein